MNGFEQRMSEFAREAVTGPLSRSLIDFTRLEEELREAHWQLGAGVIDAARFSKICGELDARLDAVGLFLKRYRTNAELYRSLEKIVDGQLPALSRTTCREVLEPVAEWFRQFERPNFVFTDPSFHVRIELLLEIARERVERHVAEMQVSAASQGKGPKESSDRPGGECAGRESLAQNQTDPLRGGHAHGRQDLPLQGWQSLREKREEILSLLATNQPDAALWRAWDFRRWAEDLVRENKELDFPDSVAGADERFRESAHPSGRNFIASAEGQLSHDEAEGRLIMDDAPRD